MTSYQLARQHGAGAILTNGRDRFEISDYSPGTRTAYGWELRTDGARQPLGYRQLPEGLTLETRKTLAARYVDQIGYDPFEDDPSLTAAQVAQILAEFAEEVAAH